MTVADMLREEGRREVLEEGRQEGRQEGLEEGLEKGLRNGLRTTLLKLLRARFGDLPEAAVTRVNAADIPQLDPWIDRVLAASTLVDVLGDL